YLPHEGTGSVVLQRSDCDAFLSWGVAFRPQGRDIMTSNGGRLTPDGTRVSLLETRAACCRNSNSQLRRQPCRSLAHSLSEWMSTKRPLPWHMSPKTMAPRSPL